METTSWTDISAYTILIRQNQAFPAALVLFFKRSLKALVFLEPLEYLATQLSRLREPRLEASNWSGSIHLTLPIVGVWRYCVAFIVPFHGTYFERPRWRYHFSYIVFTSGTFSPSLALHHCCLSTGRAILGHLMTMRRSSTRHTCDFRVFDTLVHDVVCVS